LHFLHKFYLNIIEDINVRIIDSKVKVRIDKSLLEGARLKKPVALKILIVSFELCAAFLLSRDASPSR
jgi:hypothetical protein